MSFALQVFIAVATLASLLLHRSHNKKLNELGDDVDVVKAQVGK